jgi:hypothetical protein
VLLQWAPEHSYVIGSKANLPGLVAGAEDPRSDRSRTGR